MAYRTRWLLTIPGIFLAVACGGSNSANGTPHGTPTAPTPTTPTVTITNLSISPALAVSGLTPITMSATATDSANNPLTFTWAYASATATGASNTATLTGDGVVPVQLTVTDGKGGSATQSGNVTIGNMTGNWALIADACGTQPGEQPAIMTLAQNGTSVTGTVFWPTKWCNQTPQTAGTLHDPGTIDAQGNFAALRISSTSGTVGAFLDFQATGKMDSTGRKIVGVANQSGFNNSPMTMTKQ
jgi:hypothetical protein